MDEFASRLRFAIERSGMQQKNLASAIKLSPARLSNYVNGHSEPSLDILLLLCRELRVSADYLIGLTDTISAPAKSKEKKLPTNGVLNTKRPRDPLDGLTEEQIRHVTTLINSFIAENEALIQADLASKQEA